MADEPTPGLEAMTARHVIRHLKEMAQDGAAVLLITHDLELAIEMADRILVFYDGTILEEVKPENFREGRNLKEPYTQALYRRCRNMNFLEENEMSLKAENLSFSYENGGRHVLTRISLKIEPGERVGLVAPSGYGKTTLCRLLAGYERPEEGTVEIDSIPIENIRGCMPVQLIWQHPEQALNPRWRMRQVLSEGGQVDEESRGRLGIREEWLDRFPSELSGGELQRFCIARALAANPRYLLADEITAMFDAVTQSQIWQALLHEAKERELGMVIVSHSESLLKRICTRRIDLKALQEKMAAV